MEPAEVEKIIQRAVREAVAQASKEQEYLARLVDKHEHLLYGNGKEGLTTIVDRLERAVESFQSIWNKVITTLVVAGVFGLIILLVQANLLKP